MSADFTRVLAHLDNNLREHAKRDGLSPVATAVFLARGGHAPGTVCPSAAPPMDDPHAYWCGDPHEPCRCGATD